MLWMRTIPLVQGLPIQIQNLQKLQQNGTKLILGRLTQCRVLSRVDYSDWAAPAVYVKKKSEIRVCADFSTDLNSVIEVDHHHPLPSPEEIFTKLKGRRYFSKIDLSEAYLQIPTDDESSKLLIEVCSSTNAYPLTLSLHWQ